MKIRKAQLTMPALVILILVLGVFAYPYAKSKLSIKKDKQSYEFTSIEKRDMENSISSSGTVQPVGEINVLAQMSGTVEKIYAGFNDNVKKNQPLADLNTDILKIQEKAAEASLLKAKATYEHSLLEYNNSKKLFENNMISEFDFHTAKTSLETAQADVMSAEAAMQEIQIKLKQYALIISPIDGIVLSRNVEAGDTVVAGSSSTTTLFTLAESLSGMEIEAAVDELDISRIEKNQKVRFTVDAYSKTIFYGTVSEIRLVPETSDNVVTYTVIVEADNSEGKLLPGMTASLDFISDEKKGVLAVMTQAFRFQPSEEEIKIAKRKLFMENLKNLPENEQAEAIETYDKAVKAKAGAATGNTGNLLSGKMRIPGGPPPGNKNGNNGVKKTDGSNPDIKNLWYLEEDGSIAALPVTTGISDETFTEILDPDESLNGKQIILRIRVN